MNKIIKTIAIILKHLISNLSNYCLVVGTLFILNYIKIAYGMPTTILSIGVILILVSIVIELNKQKNNFKRY